jgi:hypothetical protein
MGDKERGRGRRRKKRVWSGGGSQRSRPSALARLQTEADAWGKRHHGAGSAPKSTLSIIAKSAEVRNKSGKRTLA